MMLPRLSRVLSSSSKGFYPLTTHLHDGVCFVLRSRPRDGADDGRYGFVHGPPTGALTLTLANHPALPSRLDEASYEDLRTGTLTRRPSPRTRSSIGAAAAAARASLKSSRSDSARGAGARARRMWCSISTRRQAA